MQPLSIAKAAILGIGSLGLAWGAGTHAIGMIARTKNPELALKAVPHEPVALAMLAEIKLTEAKTAAQANVSGELAMESLRAQALNPRALRVVGFVNDANNKIEKGEAIIRQSALLSRRNLGTQLWLIEEAIRRNDTKAALHQYHLALTTSPNAKDILFPILTKAVTNQEIANELVPYVKSNEEWIVPFLALAVRDKEAVNSIADVVIKAGGIQSGAKRDQVRSDLMLALVEKGDVHRAAAIFKTAEGAPKEILASPALTATAFDSKYKGLGWSLSDDPALGSEVSGTQERRAMLAYANGGKSGRVARKALLLQPGQYQLRVAYSDLVSNPNSTIRWQISCAGSSETSPIAVGADLTKASNGNASLLFTVTSACTGQFLDLMMTGGDGRTASEVTINTIEMVKAS